MSPATLGPSGRDFPRTTTIDISQTLRRAARVLGPLRLLLAALVPLVALLAPTAGALGIAGVTVDVEAAVGPVEVAARVEPVALETTGLAAPLTLHAPPLPRASVSPPALGPPAELVPPSPVTLDPRVPAAVGASGAVAAPQVAAASGAALLWLILERFGLGRALAAMYFRVQPGELLEHERRERVVTLVRERPGIGPSEIAQDLGTGWGVTSYHLDRLERAGLVASQRVGNHRCYFLPGAVPRDQQKTVGLFRADTTRRVAQLVVERPGIPQSQLVKELGLSASAASKQLSKLESASLLRREPGEGGLRLYPEPALPAVLAPAMAT